MNTIPIEFYPMDYKIIGPEDPFADYRICHDFEQCIQVNAEPRYRFDLDYTINWHEYSIVFLKMASIQGFKTEVNKITKMAQGMLCLHFDAVRSDFIAHPSFSMALAVKEKNFHELSFRYPILKNEEETEAMDEDENRTILGFFQSLISNRG